MNYQDIVNNYKDYLYFQNTKYFSFESSFPKWEEGQIRYLDITFKDINRDSIIADISCGDGVGLRNFKKMGFKNITGVELNPLKVTMAKQSGFRVIENDFHNLSMLGNSEFDVIYSSHSLEHAYWPDKVIQEFNRILRSTGLLFIVLPYPDLNNNEEAHGAKYELGTNIVDNGISVIRFFTDRGFIFLSKQFDAFREEEIWLTFNKI